MEMINHEELNRKERIEQRVRLCLKFVKEIEYPYSHDKEVNSLVYIKKLGGLSIDELKCWELKDSN